MTDLLPYALPAAGFGTAVHEAGTEEGRKL